ncbi:glycine zipper domain-containing protein [Caballeronia sp. dw_276]|uniref:glycine zipper domain-containing protein n=1 Tax=Caballeronia sp. dw_276 TaxID=2719795 RepID=UPI001BD4FD59|nr:glycine zipper domain-containing protein [Caballeronia sp. dw_276]
MKASYLAAVAALAVASHTALAQKPAVYPAHGQSATKQSQDDGACYAWAKQNTGIDPAVVAGAPPPPQGPTGERARGAARGAAAGALVGDVNHNDAGHGAAVGATAGAVAGGVRSRRQHAAQAQNAQANEQAEMNTYWRAYSACMQGRGYTVQ